MTGSYATLVAIEDTNDIPAKHRISLPVTAANCLLTQLFLLVLRLVTVSRLVRDARLPSPKCSPEMEAALRAAAACLAADGFQSGDVLKHGSLSDSKAMLKHLRDWADKLKCDIGMMLLLPDLQTLLSEC